MKAFFIEIISSLKSWRWLTYCLYNSNRNNVATYRGEIGKALNTYSRKYENTLLMGNFNVKPDETNRAFCNQYKAKSLNEVPTWFKNVGKPFLLTCY